MPSYRALSESLPKEPWACPGCGGIMMPGEPFCGECFASVSHIERLRFVLKYERWKGAQRRYPDRLYLTVSYLAAKSALALAAKEARARRKEMAA